MILRNSRNDSIPRLSQMSLPPFYTMEMMKFAAELESSGQPVYHLEVGQPIAPTPAPVLEEAARALRECQLNYCSALGIFSSRQAIAQHYQYAYDLHINPDCVVITPGSSLGLYIALLMNFDKGDKIAVASPSYPCYRNVIHALGYSTIEIDTYPEKKYLISPEKLEEYKDISGILIASPNNPTGSMYDTKELKALSSYCEKRGIYMISDELYHGITYTEKAETVLKFNSKATIINGFSKYFSMTGWRVGWIIIPEEDINRYESLLQNVILCTSTITQIAAIKAFSCYSTLDAQVEMYKQNLNILYNALRNAGLTKIFKPNGAFYIYLELENTQLKSMDVCKKLLYEENVAVAPCMDFSATEKKCCIRLSFSQNQKVIEHAATK